MSQDSTTRGAKRATAPAPASTGRDSPQAKRLRLLRDEYGDGNSLRFAMLIGMTYTRWNNYENGVPLSIKAVIHICQRLPGITSDWLLFGKTEGMPHDVKHKLGLIRRRKRNGP